MGDLCVIIVLILGGCRAETGSLCLTHAGFFSDCWSTTGIDPGLPIHSVPYPTETACAVAEVNGDDLPDVFCWSFGIVTNRVDSRGDLWFNQGELHFNRSALHVDGATGAAFGDLDHDGHEDLVVLRGAADLLNSFRLDDQGNFVATGRAPTNTIVVYRGDGAGHFADVSIVWGFGGVSETSFSIVANVALEDFNDDGRLDLLVGRIDVRPTKAAVAPVVFLSASDGRWRRDPTLFASAAGYTWATFIGDLDGDSARDVIILNDAQPPTRAYLRVLGEPLRFQPFTVPEIFGDDSRVSAMGATLADLGGARPAALITNVGDAVLVEDAHDVARLYGLTLNPARHGGVQVTYGAAFADFDNDGLLDFFATAGTDGTHRDPPLASLFLRAGNVFVDRHDLLGDNDESHEEHGLAVADFDRDGRIDVLTASEGQLPRLLHNDLPSRSSLTVQLRGRRSNTDGIGARVTMNADGVRQGLDVCTCGSSVGNGEPGRVHFGLGDKEMADSLDVRWANGTVQTLTRVPAGVIMIVEP